MTAIPRELQEAYQLAFALKYQDRPEVTGIDVGRKYSETNGRETPQPELAVRFMVKKKKSLAVLEAEGVEPLPTSLPVVLDGKLVPTDVIESRVDPFLSQLALDAAIDLEDLKARRERCNPIQPGISVSHGTQGAGTLGLVVHCKKTGATGILSAAHVLAPAVARKGDPIYQPSPIDGGDLRFDAVARLDRWILDEDGDAAFALLNRTRMLEIQQFGKNVTVTSVARGEARLGERLTKSGRGSGATTGVVDGVGRYRLDLTDQLQVWMEGFRLVSEEAAAANGRPANGRSPQTSFPGDSGAVWYRKVAGGAEGVGLHVDGEDPGQTPEFAIACHLPRVMRRLDLDLLPVVEVPSRLPDLVAKMGKRVAPLPEELARWAAENRDRLQQLSQWWQGQGNGRNGRARGGGRPLARTVPGATAPGAGAAVDGSHPPN